MSHFNNEIYGMQKKNDTALWVIFLFAIVGLSIIYLSDKYAQDNYADLVELREINQ